MRFNDAISGVLLLVFAAAVAWNARGFPSIPGELVGPALFPQIIATGLALGGLALIATGLRRRAASMWIEIPEWLRSPRHAAGFAVVTGGLMAYVLLVERLGFFVCAPLLLAAILFILRVRWWAAVLIAVTVPLLLHAIFYKALGVPLPWGVFAPWAW
jgi:putative tricarboxylic transport membrane protein